MRHFLFLFLFAITILIFGCESQEVKIAKQLISIDDWQNASEKLELEIKNNPTNIEAHRLLLDVRRSQFFKELDINKFLTPLYGLDDFPTKEGDLVEKYIFETKRASKVTSEYVPREHIFLISLNALSLSFKNKKNPFSALKSGDDAICKDNNFRIANEGFARLSEDNKDYSDSAYLWKSEYSCGKTDHSATATEFYKLYPTSSLSWYTEFQALTDAARKLSTIQNPDQLEENFSSVISNYNEFMSKNSGKPIDISLFENELGLFFWANDLSEISKRDVPLSVRKKLIELYYHLAINSTLPENTKKTLSLGYARQLSNLGEYEKSTEILATIPTQDLDKKVVININKLLGSNYYYQKKWNESILHYEMVPNLGDIYKLDLYKAYVNVGEKNKAVSLKMELENSKDDIVKSLLKIFEAKSIKIQDIKATFGEYEIKISGSLHNPLDKDITEVIVVAAATDSNGNNEKKSLTKISRVAPNKHANFVISLYYPERTPNSIKYGAYVDSFN